MALARLIVNEGFPDDSVQVVSLDNLSVIYPSLHSLAKLTIAESSTRPITTRKWHPFDETFFKKGL